MSIVTESLETVVEGGSLAQALFAAGAITAEGKPESKFQKKQKARKAAKVAEAVTTVAAVTEEPKLVDEALDEAMFGDVLGDLLGDAKDDLFKMEALRKEADELIKQSKSMSASLRDKADGVYKQARYLRRQVYMEAGKKYYNYLHDRYGNTSSWLEVIKPSFDHDQDAWHDKEVHDPIAKARYQAKLEQVIANTPHGKMIAQKKAGEDAAFKLEFELEELKAAQERVWKSAVGKFDEANEIAKAHGWPVTTKGENKSK